MKKACASATLPHENAEMTDQTRSDVRSAMGRLLEGTGYEIVNVTDIEEWTPLGVLIMCIADVGRRCSFCNVLEGASLPDGSGRIAIVSIPTGELYCGCAIGKIEMDRRQERNRACRWCSYGWKERAGVYTCTCAYKCSNSQCSSLTPSHGME